MKFDKAIEGKVSICMPTYNRHNLIAEMIDSILAQSYGNFEIIITDNSDSSLTHDLIKSKYKDDRIRYFKNDNNLGMGGNTRKALEFITGEFFTFTADDDVWIDHNKLSKQIDYLNTYKDIPIVYTNASSIDYNGKNLEPFSSRYDLIEGEKLSAAELLPGNNTSFFLNILTPVMRTSETLPVFKESWCFESEEYFCYYIASTLTSIGFIPDVTVALREAEHYRTAIEDGKLVDWKKRKDIRIRQMISIFTTLTNLYPKTRGKLETPIVQNAIVRHLLSQAKSSRSPWLIAQTIASSYLFFRKFSLLGALKRQIRGGKSFG